MFRFVLEGELVEVIEPPIVFEIELLLLLELVSEGDECLPALRFDVDLEPRIRKVELLCKFSDSFDLMDPTFILYKCTSEPGDCV